MRIYVAGGGGMLGEAVHRVFATEHSLKCTDIDVNASWLEYCDFRDAAAYRDSVESFRTGLLIHLGAYTDLEFCESHPDDAFSTNTLSVEHAAAVAERMGIPLVYISTAGIFDGAKDVYDDLDEPNPLGVYARSKYLGEIAVQARIPRHFICRAGWMMGGGPQKDKKFIAKILRQLANGAKLLNIVDDKFGSPTYTVDFANNLAALLRTESYGLYNMVCEGATSRLEVARHLLGILRLDNEIEIAAVSSDHFKTEYSAPRPPSERLANRKLEELGLNLMRDWRLALKDYIRDYYADFVKPFAPRYDPDAK